MRRSSRREALEGGRRFARLAFLLMTAILCAVASNAAATPRDRIALVIGNTNYSDGLPQLPLAKVDADLMAESLRKAGYSDAAGRPVTAAADLTAAQLVRAVQDFDAKLGAAPEDSVGILYFAGHGLARQRRGDVYLLPVDALARTPRSIDDVGVPLADLLQLLRSHKGRTVVLIVDACRNVPPEFLVPGARSAQRAAGLGWGDNDGDAGGLGLLSRGGARDFSEKTPDAADYFVAFSTSPDRAAYDTELFSKIIAEEITKGNHDLLTLFKKVGERMAAESRASGALQLPTYEVGIYGTPPCFGVCPANSDPSHFFDCATCPWMRVIHPGRFTYGSPLDEPGRDGDEGLA
jgi:uncharacterized caspase-like protein